MMIYLLANTRIDIERHEFFLEFLIVTTDSKT